MSLYTQPHQRCAVLLTVLRYQTERQSNQEKGCVCHCSGVNAAVYDPELWGYLGFLEDRDTVLDPEECHWVPQQWLFLWLLPLFLSGFRYTFEYRISCHGLLPSQITLFYCDFFAAIASAPSLPVHINSGHVDVQQTECVLSLKHTKTTLFATGFYHM